MDHRSFIVVFLFVHVTVDRTYRPCYCVMVVVYALNVHVLTVYVRILVLGRPPVFRALLVAVLFIRYSQYLVSFVVCM